MDRLYRNFADYVKVDGLGVELHFVKDGMVVSESSKSQDKFMHGIRVLMAKNYVDNLSEEIRKGLEEQAAQGIYPTHAPLGYLNAQEPGTKRKVIVPDPARAHLVRELFELYGTGNHSLNTLVKHARQQGLTTKKGLSLPKSAIDKILKHPAYCGIVRWNGREAMGIHEPLVSKELWDRVQNIRTGRGHSNTGYGAMKFTYRGMVQCQCGMVMTGEIKKGKYVYHHCTGERRSSCNRPYVAESKITEGFAGLLERMTVPEQMMGWIRDGMREADADRQNRRSKREQTIKAEIQALRSRLERLYLDKVDGEITPEFFREMRANWDSRITDLQLELAALDRAEPSAVDEAMRILELASTAHLRFKMANSEQKRELLKFVLSNSSWVDGKLEAELLEFFDLMLNLIKIESEINGEAVDNRLAKINPGDWWRLMDAIRNKGMRLSIVRYNC